MEDGSGYIETVAATDLRVGDVFSTDGYTVTWACLLSGGGTTDEVSVVVAKDDHEKTAYLAPDFECHLWRERPDPAARSDITTYGAGGA